MIEPRYLTALLLGAILWFAAFLLLTLVVDSYGVSPLRVSLSRINEFKPKRLDIDRLIKPFEVWRYQPRTIFLGTSRIHQSIDPAALDRSSYAPAYNASIPASSLGLNISHLRQYIEFDPGLRTVFVELFLYNFLGQGQERAPKTLREYLGNTVTLFLSADTLLASIQTVAHNLIKHRPVHEIKPGGYFYYPPGHDAKGPFDGFAAGIWNLHQTRAGAMKLHEPAFEAVSEIVQVCREHNLQLIFLLTPNHAYDDYYLESIDAWKIVEQWLTRLSEAGVVYSFSQPNDWVYEPVKHQMRYWNDPYHFTLITGSAMQRAAIGEQVDGAPANFMVRMTPQAVAAHIDERRKAIREWARHNPEFVAKFNEERQKWEASRTAKK